ncbi:MAG: hypothetical protein FWH14_04795 [Oscillospiraceae bacterium]|nr:hypothetical protein [Oscillospiraceae bacterium]
MAKTITYPRRGIKREDVINQDTFNRLTQELFLWKQGPGNIGGMHLHSCWGETSVLGKKYHGQTVFPSHDHISGAILLYERTGNPKWKIFANEIISNLLFLQCDDGGFRHASGEYEPTYISGATCPIHQNYPILAMLAYAGWEHGDKELKELIKPAIDKHWAWFNDDWWMRGPGKTRPMDVAGWCAVTNQDMTVIAALSGYGRVYGDMSRYEKWGKPALDTFLSSRYYYDQIGLFERGDGVNFTERTSYFSVIFVMLNKIYNDTKDERIPQVLDNCAAHVFDAIYTGDDGHTYLAWGAKTDPDDKSYVVDWMKTPVVINEYPFVLKQMEDYLSRHPDPEKRAALDKVEETFYGCIFCDGVLPGAFWPKDPIITIAASPNCKFWLWMVEQLGDDIRDPEPVEELCRHRVLDNYVWKRKRHLWTIERDGERVYGGYTPIAMGVTLGDQSPALGSYADLDNADVIEVINHA